MTSPVTFYNEVFHAAGHSMFLPVLSRADCITGDGQFLFYITASVGSDNLLQEVFIRFTQIGA